MITSNQILEFAETYIDSKNISGHDVVIISNPTVKEALDISQASKKLLGVNQVRFTANNKDKKVYVWDSSLSDHATIRRFINLESDYLKTPWLLNGVATVNNSINMIRMDNFNATLSKALTSYDKIAYDFLIKLLKTDWFWLNSYIKNNDCMNKSREIVVTQGKFYGKRIVFK
jgi:hypothetical protein